MYIIIETTSLTDLVSLPKLHLWNESKNVLYTTSEEEWPGFPCTVIVFNKHIQTPLFLGAPVPITDIIHFQCQTLLYTMVN